VTGAVEGLGDGIDEVKEAVGGLGEKIDGVTTAIGSMGDEVKESKGILAEIRDYVRDIFGFMTSDDYGFNFDFEFDFEFEFDEDGNVIVSGNGGGGFWSFLGKVIETIGNVVAAAITTLGDVIKEPINAILDFLMTAFIPKEGFFEEQGERVRMTIDDKMPLFGQLSSMISEVNNIYKSYNNQMIEYPMNESENGYMSINSAIGEFEEDNIIINTFAFDGKGGDGSEGGFILNSTSTHPGKPELNITLPEKYGGGTFSVIDFSFFDQYRSFIHGFILFIAYSFAVRKAFKRYAELL
jgi:hypothetical protein